MAGSEKNGFANSKAHLIENAYYILTPSAKVSEEKINAYRNFVSSLKALPIVLDYRQHDCITGTISHLPHIIASTLVNFVRDTDTKEELMKALAAGGFKRHYEDRILVPGYVAANLSEKRKKYLAYFRTVYRSTHTS